MKWSLQPRDASTHVDEKHAKDTQANRQYHPALVVLSVSVGLIAGIVIGVNLPAFAGALDRHEGAVVGSATAIVALFTWALWRATMAIDEGGKATLAHMDRTARSELRAYVGVLGTEFHWSDIPTVGVQYKISITNHGKTPAVNLNFSMSHRILPFPLPKADLLIPNADTDPVPSAVLHPGCTTHGLSSCDLEPTYDTADYDALARGEDRTGKDSRLYCFGRVEYTDAFGSRHWTDYCYYQEPEAFMVTPGKKVRRKSILRYCHLHNEIGTYSG